jgi:hypothetical protein
MVSPERKAQIEREASERGCSWLEVVHERMELALEELTDPIAQQRFKRQEQYRELPFGKDPLLQQDGDR